VRVCACNGYATLISGLTGGGTVVWLLVLVSDTELFLPFACHGGQTKGSRTGHMLTPRPLDRHGTDGANNSRSMAPSPNQKGVDRGAHAAFRLYESVVVSGLAGW
jgi:hypothetical protein